MDEIDFFSLGLDSMGIAHIVGQLVAIGFNFVKAEIIYENPTIYMLTARLKIHPILDVERMASLVEKYSTFPEHPIDHNRSPGITNRQVVTFPHPFLYLISAYGLTKTWIS